MLRQNKTGKATLKNNPLTDGNGTFDLTFLSLFGRNLGGSDHDFTAPNRSQKLGFSSTEDHVGIIDRQHGGIVAQTEGKTTMDQAGIIGAHLGTGNKLNNSPPFGKVNRRPDPSRRYR